MSKHGYMAEGEIPEVQKAPEESGTVQPSADEVREVLRSMRQSIIARRSELRRFTTNLMDEIMFIEEAVIDLERRLNTHSKPRPIERPTVMEERIMTDEGLVMRYSGNTGSLMDGQGNSVNRQIMVDARGNLTVDDRVTPRALQGEPIRIPATRPPEPPMSSRYREWTLGELAGAALDLPAGSEICIDFGDVGYLVHELRQYDETVGLITRGESRLTVGLIRQLAQAPSVAQKGVRLNHSDWVYSRFRVDIRRVDNRPTQLLLIPPGRSA